MTKKADRFAAIPAGANALCYAAFLHRRVDPMQWPVALNDVPADKRDDAESYLRGIAQRMRVIRSIGDAKK